MKTSISPKISEMLTQRSEEVIKEKISEQEAQKEPESLEEVTEEVSETIKEPEVQEKIITDQTIDKAQELVDVDQQATEKQAVEPQKEGEP